MSQWEHRYLGQERDQRALEFGDAGEYSQYHAAGRRGRVGPGFRVISHGHSTSFSG
jgi:hypothetical protein